MLEFYSLGKDLKIHSTPIIPRQPDSIDEEVETIWNRYQEKREQKLFNGKIVSVREIDEDTIKVQITEYKNFIAQRQAPGLYNHLKVQPLAVSAIILCREGLVFGLRSSSCTTAARILGTCGIRGN